MFSYVELYCLVYRGEIEGYRIYAVTADNQERYYDFQTSDTSLSNWSVGRLQLKLSGGGYLVTDDELSGKYKPIQINSMSPELHELLNQVKYYYRLSTEGSGYVYSQ